jgi:hypothetical protein
MQDLESKGQKTRTRRERCLIDKRIRESEFALPLPFYFSRIISYGRWYLPILGKGMSSLLGLTDSNANVFETHSQTYSEIMLNLLSGHPLAQSNWHLTMFCLTIAMGSHATPCTSAELDLKNSWMTISPVPCVCQHSAFQAVLPSGLAFLPIPEAMPVLLGAQTTFKSNPIQGAYPTVIGPAMDGLIRRYYSQLVLYPQTRKSLGTEMAWRGTIPEKHCSLQCGPEPNLSKSVQ